MNRQSTIEAGYTLMEFAVTMAVVGIMAMVAASASSAYFDSLNATQVENKINDLVNKVEQYAVLNVGSTSGALNYKGFPYSEIMFPATNKPYYRINIADLSPGNPALDNSQLASGEDWSIRAISLSPNSYSYLINSNGVRCKTLQASQVSFDSCGNNNSEWLPW